MSLKTVSLTTTETDRRHPICGEIVRSVGAVVVDCLSPMKQVTVYYCCLHCHSYTGSTSRRLDLETEVRKIESEHISDCLKGFKINQHKAHHLSA
jgi:hypothetical protein